MQQNITINPVQRLAIAASIMAGSAGHIDGMLQPGTALDAADALIKQSGCIVEGSEVLEHEMD